MSRPSFHATVPRRSFDVPKGLLRGLNSMLCQSLAPPSTKQRRHPQSTPTNSAHRPQRRRLKIMADKVSEITLGLMYCTLLPRDSEHDSYSIISACSPRVRNCMFPRSSSTTQQQHHHQFQYHQTDHPYENGSANNPYNHHRCYAGKRNSAAEEEMGIEVDECTLRLESAYNLERV